MDAARERIFPYLKWTEFHRLRDTRCIRSSIGET